MGLAEIALRNVNGSFVGERAEVLEQRLRDLELPGGGEGRIHSEKTAIGGEFVGAESCLEIRARGEDLRVAKLRCLREVIQDAGALQFAVGLGFLTLVAKASIEDRVEELVLPEHVVLRGVDGGLIDADIRVVGQRQVNGIVEREHQLSIGNVLLKSFRRRHGSQRLLNCGYAEQPFQFVVILRKRGTTPEKKCRGTARQNANEFHSTPPWIESRK